MVNVVNNFTYTQPDGRPDLDIGVALNKACDEQMLQMEYIAKRLVYPDQNLTLSFFGNPKKGVRFIIECDDAQMVDRLQKVLKEFEQQQDADFFG